MRCDSRPLERALDVAPVPGILVASGVPAKSPFKASDDMPHWKEVVPVFVAARWQVDDHWLGLAGWMVLVGWTEAGHWLL